VGPSIALLRGPGRAAALALVAAALVLRIIDPGIITELRVRSFDLAERVWPRAGDSARVAIVDIDEKSLARYGQWPWPWHRVAELVRRIAQGNPRVLGIDVVLTRSAFAGRDRARTARPAFGRDGRVGAAAAERTRPR
jgi:CHASE2 domain-containing sensor protein